MREDPAPAGDIFGGGAQDVRALCARLVRFDPATLVRATAGAIWAWLPFDVLVTRPVRTHPSALTVGDAAYRADAILEYLSGGPAPVDLLRQWQGGALPIGAGRTIEEIPVVEVRRIASAAAESLRAAPAGIGERRVRDTLLDHIAVTVVADVPESTPTRIPLRLVLGLSRVGFLGEGAVVVRRSGGWVGLVADYGAAWYRQPLSLRPIP